MESSELVEHLLDKGAAFEIAARHFSDVVATSALELASLMQDREAIQLLLETTLEKREGIKFLQ